MHDMRQIPCPMCGRRVTISENSPVPCPSCGVPVSAPAAEPPVAPILTDDDSATRVATIPPSEPAPAVAAPAVVATAIPVAEPPAPPSAPLLPASEVADPRTQPVSAAEVQQVAYPPATPALAATPAPASEQPITQTYHATPLQQPETQPYTPVAPFVPQLAQSTSKRNPALLIVSVIVAVVILLAIIGAAVVFANRAGLFAVATPTATTAATATATVPAGFIQFTDDGNVYKLNYPSAWRKTTVSTSGSSGSLSLMLFSDAPSPSVFEVEYIKTTAGTTTSDDKSLLDFFFSGLGATGTVTNKQSSTSVLLAGETWPRETADVVQGKNTLNAVVMATNHGQYRVLIAYLGSKDSFTSVDSQYFQPMLNSFQFVQ